MYTKKNLYIGGKWVCPTGSGMISVINPATEELLGSVPDSSMADADAAVSAAVAAQEAWGKTPVSERGEYLTRIHQGLAARAEEIATIIADEVGMPLKLSRRIQAGLPVFVTDSYRTILQEYVFEERLGNSLVVREPVGVVACITPWNYPLHQVVAKVIPALAAGCTVVVKPSEVAPLTAFILAEIIHEAGVPAGVFNLVSGTGAGVGEYLARHENVDLVSFTGSLRAGRRVAELAAGTVKRVTLELGGKSAAVVLDDADLAVAVKGTVAACYLNSGQTCTAHTRLLVHESQYAECAALAVEAASAFLPGDPRADQTKLGPLVTSTQRERVLAFIQQGVDEGAELLTGGIDPPAGLERGWFVQPSVFGKVTPDMAIAQEEIFGPVLSILTYRDDDEAVAIANGTKYGLAAAVWSGSDERALAVARRLKAGQVDINGGAFNVKAPFGGCKQSGYGRELGVFGLEEFLELKSMQLKM